MGAAKLNLIPVRRGYWGGRIGSPHTVPMKVHGKTGSVHLRLIPAPRGSGVVGSPTLKKILQFAGVADCFSSSCAPHTATCHQISGNQHTLCARRIRSSRTTWLRARPRPSMSPALRGLHTED